jgi:hypothetical protein
MNGLAKNIYDYSNDIFGLPQKYKGVDFYPIKLRDLKYHEIFNKTMLYPKNHIPDKQILKMSYIKYLLLIVQRSLYPEQNIIYDWLVDLIRYITKIDNVYFKLGYKTLEGNALDMIGITGYIDDVAFDENEFDVLREIILEQNCFSIEYVNEYNPQLEEKLAFVNRGSQDIDLKDEVFTFCSLSGMTVNEVSDYTLYQFKHHFERLMMLKDFDLYKPLLASGQIKLKNGDDIKHFFVHTNRTGRYDSILIAKDKYIQENEFFGVAKTN